MTTPVPLASGRDADVFALSETRVLRRYRRGGDVTAEAAVMTYVARHGFPVPEVHAAERTDLVLERVDGPTLLQALRAGEVSIAAGAATLADLHDRLHALPPRLSQAPTVRILHQDLHPDNVMLSTRGPLLIDWRNAAEGPPELDIAVSALILGQVAVDDTNELALSAQALLTAFLSRVGHEPLRLLEYASRYRGADPNLSHEEARRLARAVALVRRCYRTAGTARIRT